MNAEHIVARTDELADGQMKQVELEDRNILLLRMGDTYRAYVAECPHHGAPLAEGLLHDGHVRCPWHQAVFDADNGELLQPPALDRLAHYDVKVKGDDVIVVIPEDTAADVRGVAMASLDAGKDNRTFGIVGSGAAGLAAAETLRREGYQGRIVMLTQEEEVSYDRTDLSKRYLADPEEGRPTIRSMDFYGDHDIEVQAGREVTEVDVASRKVTLEDGDCTQYDKLLIATGGVPRRLGVDGADLSGVFTLRSLADCNAIRQAAQSASRAVVVGASFIGMEVAASLVSRGLDVTVVAPEAVPFEKVLGREIGQVLRGVHEGKDVQFRLENGVEGFDGDNGAIGQVVLKDGEKLEADLVVVGIGVRPATGFLKDADTNKDGSVAVDSRLRLADGVYAAGDIASFPDWRDGEPIRIEHWRLAQQLGQTAARNMLDKDVPYDGVPFFWTSQHKVIIEYVGCAPQWDDLVIDGDLDERDFVGCYVRGGRVRAAVGCGRSWEMDAIAEILKRPEAPTAESLRDQMAQMSAR